MSVDIETKDDIREMELAHAQADAEKPDVNVIVSPYARLGLSETIRTFKVPIMYGCFAAFNACNDGYCYSIPGTCSSPA